MKSQQYSDNFDSFVISKFPENKVLISGLLSQPLLWHYIENYVSKIQVLHNT